MKPKVLLLIGLIQLLALEARPQDTQLLVDDIPAIADTASRILYVSTIDNCEQGFNATFTTGGIPFNFDGTEYEDNSRVQVTSRTDPHTIIFKNGVVQDEWGIVFTLLPIVSIDYGEDSGISKENEVPGYIRIASPEQANGEGQCFESNILIHWRGSTGLQFPKKNYAITLVDNTGKEKNSMLLDIRSDSKWILDAMAIDYSRMRNRLCTDIWNAFSSPHPTDNEMIRNGTKGHFVEVIRNGRYHGLYCLTDKINRKLLGLKKTQNEGTDDETVRGVLYKCVGTDYSTCQMQMPAEDIQCLFTYNDEKWFDWELKYPNTPSEKAWATLVNTILYGTQAKDSIDYNNTNIDKYYYEQNAADYCMFIHALMLMDNLMHNVYLSSYNIQESTKLWFTPWDMDGSFSRDGYGVYLPYTSYYEHTFQDVQPFRPLYQAHGGTFFNLMAQTWECHRKKTFHPDSIAARINAYATLFERSGAWQREVERWNNNIVTPLGVTMELPCDIHEETNMMIAWYERNYAHMEREYAYAGILPSGGINTSPIQNIDTKQRPIYDLQGRRVKQVRSGGIYIRNGQKFIAR